jgi:glutamate dehydrogenase
MLAADDHWHTRAKAALRDDLAAILRSLTADALQGEGGPAAWKTRNASRQERFRQILADLHAAEAPDLAMLSVAVRELRNLTR